MTNTTFTEKQDIFNKTIIKNISKMSEKDGKQYAAPLIPPVKIPARLTTELEKGTAALPHKLQEAKKIENLFESLELKQEEIKKKKDDIDFLFNNNKGKIDIEEKDNEKYQQNDT